MTEHGIISIISISRERERERQKEPDTQTEIPQSDLLGSLQEPKIMNLFLWTHKI